MESISYVQIFQNNCNLVIPPILYQLYSHLSMLPFAFISIYFILSFLIVPFSFKSPSIKPIFSVLP